MVGNHSKLKELIELRTLELRASEARFHNIVTISSDGIVIVNGAGLIHFVNPAAESIFGRKAKELLGREFGFPIVSGKTTELDIVQKGHKQTIVEMRVVTTEWEGNTAYLATLRDITERKRADEEIKRLNLCLAARAAELEAFNYTVSHDLRQPLNIINGYCQAIDTLCGDRLQEDCRSYLQEVYNGTLRMNLLIEALLNFSRMGHVEPSREMVDLGLLTREVALSLNMTEADRQVDFQIADRIFANADADLMRIVLNNLLGNAWKYTGMQEKAIIEIGVTYIDEVPVYFVRDNGAGFDKADADKLFVPFQRLPGAEKFKGLGIGLATVERIIRSHGGKIWAEGEPGKGATFYFTLSPVQMTEDIA